MKLNRAMSLCPHDSVTMIYWCLQSSNQDETSFAYFTPISILPINLWILFSYTNQLVSIWWGWYSMWLFIFWVSWCAHNFLKANGCFVNVFGCCVFVCSCYVCEKTIKEKVVMHYSCRFWTISAIGVAFSVGVSDLVPTKPLCMAFVGASLLLNIKITLQHVFSLMDLHYDLCCCFEHHHSSIPKWFDPSTIGAKVWLFLRIPKGILKIELMVINMSSI